MEISFISVSRIRVAYNSRKTLYDNSIEELAKSIKSVGLINPISVYLNSDNDYTILAGERRFRAMVSLNYTEIPCIIRDYESQDKNVTFNIIENIQREQLNIIEEIKSLFLLYENGYKINDLCDLIGKSRFYVLSRLKMSTLINEYHSSLLDNSLSIQKAMIIAKLTPEQQHILFGNLSKMKQMNASELENMIVSKFYLSLDNAPFDIKSTTLHPSAGACINCKFNTAVTSLFAEDKAYCNYHVCFKEKVQKNLISILDNDHDLFVISDESFFDYKTINPLENNLVFLPNDPINPKEPVYSDYSLDNYPDEQKMLEAFNNDCKIYELKLSEYADHIDKIREIYETQDVFKGIYLQGPNPGVIRYFYISNKETKEIIKDENAKEPVSESIDSIISKKDKLNEDKLVELYSSYYSLLSENDVYATALIKMSSVEEDILREILQTECHSIMIDIRILLRQFILSRVKKNNDLLRKLVEHFNPDGYNEIISKITDKYDRKAARLQSRIDEKLRANKPGIPSSPDVRKNELDVPGNDSNVDSEQIPNAEIDTELPNEDSPIQHINFDSKPKSFFDAIIHKGTSPDLPEDSNQPKQIDNGNTNVPGIGVDNQNIPVRQQSSSTRRNWKGAPEGFDDIPKSSFNNTMPQNNLGTKPLDSFIRNESVVVPRNFDDIVL